MESPKSPSQGAFGPSYRKTMIVWVRLKDLEKFDTIYHTYRRFGDRYTPALQRSAMSIENPMPKFPHFLRLAMCEKTAYRTYGAGASSRMATINMLLRMKIKK